MASKPLLRAGGNQEFSAHFGVARAGSNKDDFMKFDSIYLPHGKSGSGSHIFVDLRKSPMDPIGEARRAKVNGRPY